LNQIKILQQLEQQKELLHQGAEMVDKASVWYRRQIQLIENQIVSGKIRAGQYWTGSTDISTSSYAANERQLLDLNPEQQKEVLNVLASKVLHINCQLRSLMEGDILCKR
jgi:hypothetical protein